MATTDTIANRRVAFVGKLGGINRKEARAIVRRLGGTMLERLDETATMIVIGADVMTIDEPEELLADWISEGVAEDRIVVIDETQFWQRLGVVEPEMDVSQLYTPAMLAELLEVPISTVRRWHRRGLITPTRQVKRLPYFDFQEVSIARRISEMIASGTNPKTIENRLSRLAKLYPDLQKPLGQLSLIVEGQRVLLKRSDGLVELGGQKRIDFDAFTSEPEQALDAPEVATISITEAPGFKIHETPIDHPPVTRDDFIRLAMEHEDENEIDSAIEVYRSLAFAYGPTPDVCFRIAELLYHQNDLAGARERYSMAIELEDGFVEARASLGCVLVELGQLEMACAAFEGALAHHDDYPDVHFHLARLLDEMRQPARAETHWRRFLELTPKSPWASEAKDRLEQHEARN